MYVVHIRNNVKTCVVKIPIVQRKDLVPQKTNGNYRLRKQLFLVKESYI